MLGQIGTMGLLMQPEPAVLNGSGGGGTTLLTDDAGANVLTDDSGTNTLVPA